MVQERRHHDVSIVASLNSGTGHYYRPVHLSAAEKNPDTGNSQSG
jgi:hypothetical protein